MLASVPAPLHAQSRTYDSTRSGCFAWALSRQRSRLHPLNPQGAPALDCTVQHALVRRAGSGQHQPSLRGQPLPAPKRVSEMSCTGGQAALRSGCKPQAQLLGGQLQEAQPWTSMHRRAQA